MGNRFTPERGIRQDDPRSCYTFIICAEYLGIYINFMENQPKSGIFIKLNRDPPTIHFLMFADDCVTFCRANKTTARNIKQILDHYCIVSGLINY